MEVELPARRPIRPLGSGKAAEQTGSDAGNERVRCCQDVPHLNVTQVQTCLSCTVTSGGGVCVWFLVWIPRLAEFREPR
jgi:hypothetical protein